jgi:hypothetical protein
MLARSSGRLIRLAPTGRYVHAPCAVLRVRVTERFSGKLQRLERTWSTQRPFSRRGETHALCFTLCDALRCAEVVRFNEGMELEDAVHTAILTLKEGFDGKMTNENIEIAIASTATRSFTILTPQQVDDYLALLE